MKKVVLLIILILFPINISANTKEKVLFDKCVDGDTASFIYKDKSEKFRFLAIDTPESTNKIEPFGKEASSYTCNILKSAKKIEIEFDSNSNEKDKYGRYLAWIYVDDKLLQDNLVKKGYAKVAYLYGDYAYTKQLQESEIHAKNNKLNIWQDYAEEDINWIYILIGGLIIIILCTFNKKYRNKIIKNSKSSLKKELKKLIK